MKVPIPLALGLLVLVVAFAIYLFPKPAQIGQALEQGGRLDEALVYYRQALAADPQDEPTWIRVASVYEVRGQTQDAIGVYRRLVELDPTNVGYHRHLALLLEWSLQIDEAMSQLATVADLEPRDVGVRQKLARYAVLRHKDYSEAIRRLEEIVEGRPSDVDALVELAELYTLTRQLPKAILAYDRALQEDPDNPRAARLRAKATAWQREVEGAIARFGAALDLDPNDRAVLTRLALLLRAVGRETEAQGFEARSASLQGAGP